MRGAYNLNERLKAATLADNERQALAFVADVERYIEQERVDFAHTESIHAFGLWLAKRGWAKP